MKVSDEINYKFGSKIQFAIISNGGESSWKNDDSVRLAWYNDAGKFDPISSSELPIWSLKDIINECANRDMFNKAEIASMIGQLTSSLYRQ